MTRVTRTLAMAVVLIVTVTGVAQAYFTGMATGSGTVTATVGTWSHQTPPPQPPGPPAVPPGPPVTPPVTPTPPAKCVVPNLKGKTMKQAAKALGKSHCQLGKVTTQRRHHRVKHVMSQTAKPRSVHPNHFRVNVRVR